MASSGCTERLRANSVEEASVNCTLPWETSARICSVSVSSRSIHVGRGTAGAGLRGFASARCAAATSIWPRPACDDRDGPGRAATIDEVLPDTLIARTELDATGQRDAGREAGRSDVGPPRGDLLDGVLPGLHHVQTQGNAQVLGKLAGQVVGRAFRAMAAQVVGVRAVPGRPPAVRPRPGSAGATGAAGRRWPAAGWTAGRVILSWREGREPPVALCLADRWRARVVLRRRLL